MNFKMKCLRNTFKKNKKKKKKKIFDNIVYLDPNKFTKCK